jgi:tetratricopeptide (TPR) repeat protein
MNKKAKRAYDKSMNYYEKGEINKALEICEEVLFEGLDNPDVLNFKGLLLYQKGNLNEAIIAWKINEDLNNDDIAKNYIKDSIADEKRIGLYREGEQALKQLKIDKALELFKICAESDFNAIKVNTAIGMCYQKKGDFYRAKEYVDKALRIDKNAITAKIIEKELKEEGMYSENKNSSKGFLIGITILFVVFAIAAGGYLVFSKFKNKDLTINIKEVKSNEVLEEKKSTTEDIEELEVKKPSKVNKDTTSEEITKEESKSVSFDKEKLKTLIANNDLDGVYEQLKNVKKESISNEDLTVYKKAIDLMNNQGIAKFYEYGLWYFNQNNYSDARISFDKAYTYCEGSSIKEHILFYRASNSLRESNMQIALAQYEEYYKQYPKGVYVQETLYELALLNKTVDKEKSKSYANSLINNFPGSIYINDNITSITRS